MLPQFERFNHSELVHMLSNLPHSSPSRRRSWQAAVVAAILAEPVVAEGPSMENINKMRDLRFFDHILSLFWYTIISFAVLVHDNIRRAISRGRSWHGGSSHDTTKSAH